MYTKIQNYIKPIDLERKCRIYIQNLKQNLIHMLYTISNLKIQQ